MRGNRTIVDYYCPYCGDDMGRIRLSNKEVWDRRLKDYYEKHGVCPHWNNLEAMDEF